MFTTEDFPQADRIFAVGRLVTAVYNGAQSDLEMEAAIELNSVGRQGRYYRKAAVVLGLLEKTPDGYNPTDLGVEYAVSTAPGVRTSILRKAVRQSPVFAALIDYIAEANPSRLELRNKMYDIYPGEVGTAKRRWSSVHSYLLDLGLVVEVGENMFLAERVLPGPELSALPAEEEMEIGAPTVGDLESFSKRYAGFCADPRLRKAVETQAIAQAIEYYESLGYQVTDVGATHSYDLHAVNSHETRHVEVKGSQGVIAKIILTKNEVVHAQTYEPTDLITVGEISWVEKSGDFLTSSGSLTAHMDWKPSDSSLEPLSYYYSLD